MKTQEISRRLRVVGDADHEWRKARTAYETDRDRVLKRLLHEAVAARFSVEKIARDLRLGVKPAITLLRKYKLIGVRSGTPRPLLADKASGALQHNAELLGINPSEFDLTSPLAYLPMGADLKARLIHDRMESDRCALVEVLSKTWRTLADEGYEASPEQSCEVFANALIDAGWHR